VQVPRHLSVRAAHEHGRRRIAIVLVAVAYAVSANGQRFLIDSVANGSAQEPITFLINWTT
jgi:hypothetical protein